jgi:uncharacterized membrane protein (Fun14 family)
MWVMIWILLSVFFVLLFVAITVFLLQYLVLSFESGKIQELAKNIKDKNGVQFFNKHIARRNFSAFDLNNSILRSRQIAKTMYQQTVAKITKRNDDITLQNIAHNTTRSLKNTADATGSFFGNLAANFKRLITPISQKDEVTDVKIQPIDWGVDEKLSQEEEYKKDVTTMIIDESIISDKGGATIGVSSSDTSHLKTMTPQAQELFEKLENKIIEKLREGGMSNNDLWLELGDLYVKFDMKEKAKSIYALVLKHSEDKTKDIARNKLIGLS